MIIARRTCLNTYLVFLRFQHMRGILDDTQLESRDSTSGASMCWRKSTARSSCKKFLTVWQRGAANPARPKRHLKPSNHARSKPPKSSIRLVDGRGVAMTAGQNGVCSTARWPVTTVRFVRRRKKKRNFDEAELVEILQSCP